MESIEANESKQSIESVITDCNSDRNSLLIRLNGLLTNISLINKQLIALLMQIYCTHADSYVRLMASKVVINYVIESKQKIDFISDTRWHCLPQMSQFLTQFLSRLSTDNSVGFESLISEVSNKLIELNEYNCKSCEEHCMCYIPDLVQAIHRQTNDKDLNKIVLNLIEVNAIQEKRCFLQKSLNLFISVVKHNENNCLLMKSISDWIFKPNFFSESINIRNIFYAFGGKYSSDNEKVDNEFGCDVVLLRQSVLLSLLTLSSQFITKSTSDDIIEKHLKSISAFVGNKNKNFEENDWIIKLFIEEDEQLLCALYCRIKLGDNLMAHYLMNSFVSAIEFDSSVLLDMTCSDEQTATLLLKLLLIYLKLTDITINIGFNVKNVLLELRDKMQRLTEKELFPYNVKPLIRLLNKLND